MERSHKRPTTLQWVAIVVVGLVLVAVKVFLPWTPPWVDYGIGLIAGIVLLRAKVRRMQQS